MIKPMLCKLIKEPFDSKEWIFETKWDGYRAVAEVQKKRTLLYSRNQKSFAKAYPEIVKALGHIRASSAVLDGEIVAFDSKGQQNFQLLQNYQKLQEGKVAYLVFDLLFLNGKDLRKLPLVERKRLLKKIIPSSGPIKYTSAVKGKGTAFFKRAEKRGLEGIIGKRSESRYRSGRFSDWVKIKTHQRQEVVIGGYTKGKGARGKLGALLIGVYKGGSLYHIGKVGGGFSRESLAAVLKKLKSLEQEKCPFKPSVASPGTTWVRPTLVCEVSFAEWTRGGKLRQPIFRGMRKDKRARQVKRERAK